MNQILRLLIVTAALLAGLTPHCMAADAAHYPGRAVRIIVGYSPGTTSDVVARLIAQKLSERWSQPVVIENRDGASGSIAADLVARAVPDGYTLMVISNAFTLGPVLRRQLPYDPFRDFAAITQITQVPNVLLVGRSLGVNNVKEFVALAKSSPHKLQYASSGRGTPSHLSVELFKALTGAPIEEIPYKSSSQALTDTISGQVALNSPGLAQGLPQVRGGKVIALGVTSLKRASGAPDIPTLAEEGVPGYEANGWHGLFAPAKTPPDVLAFLSKEMLEILATADMRERFKSQGAEVVASTPGQFAEFLRNDFEKWQKLLKELGIKPE